MNTGYRLSAKTLSALGAIPVGMAQSEAYEALSKGVVKGNLGPDEVLQGWKQAEVTSFLTKTPFLYNTLFFVTMNKEQWEALGPELQQAITQVNQKYFEEVAAGCGISRMKLSQMGQEDKGMQVVGWAEERADLLQILSAGIRQNIAGIGVNGEEILDRFWQQSQFRVVRRAQDGEIQRISGECRPL